MMPSHNGAATPAGGSDSAAPPPGLEVFLIDGRDRALALLVYEVPAEARMPPLTSAERAVWRALMQGRTNAEIAAARKTAPRTVANQVARLFAKLNVQSRTALALRWVALP
jgi:DNA-binding NarL/FixJ family response regulator